MLRQRNQPMIGTKSSNSPATPIKPANPLWRSRLVRLDVVLILAIGLVAECAHFTWRDGRPVLNGDSVQYVDSAEALLTPGLSATFALRKPGYPLLLAGVGWLTGNMSWSALAVNHVLLGMLPLAAYGIGCILLSRAAGWLAALLAMARLQTLVTGDRIMSESPFMLLLAFGILCLATVLRDQRTMRLLAVAGLLLAMAWLFRAVAIVTIFAGLVCCAWLFRDRPKRLVGAWCCLILPLAGAAIFECSMNYTAHGQFRTSTGSLGLMLMMRTRHLQGLPLPRTETVKRCLDLLPERDPEDAFRASELDTWVARYRAIHDLGLDEWQTDALMKQAALQIAAAHPLAFLEASQNIFARHLLRRAEIRLDRYVPIADRQPCIVHPAAVDDPDAERNWYAYWGLPHRSLEESRDLAKRMQTAAEARAPFARTEPMPTLRYASMSPAVTDVATELVNLASIWPGFALILFLIVGPSRGCCALLGLTYVLEAGLISLCCPSEIAAARYQSVWLVSDSALAAALLAVPVHVAWSRIRTGTWYGFGRRFTAPSASPI